MKKQKQTPKGLKHIHQINMLCQLHPTNQTIRRQVTMSILSGSHQNNNDTKLQTNCICNFMISWWKGLGQWLRQLTKKNPTKKTFNCSTLQMKQLHVLLNLPIKNVTKTFQILIKCKDTWKNKLQDKKRNLAMKVVKKKKSMVIRQCRKQFNIKLNINSVCQLY